MQNRSSGVRGLVFGGIMAALVVVFALVPYLSIFMPLPLILAYLRYSGRVAVLTSIVAALLSSIFVGPVQAFLILVPTGILPGLTFGYGIRRKLKPLVTGLLAVGVFFLGFALNYVITRAVVLEGRDPIVVAAESEQGRQLLNDQFDAFEKVIQNMPTEREDQRQAVEQMKTLVEEGRRDPVAMTWSLLPMGIFLMAAFSSWLTYMLARWILPRFGHEVPRPAPFGEFYLPAWLSALYLALSLGAGYLGRTIVNAPWWAKLLMNVITPLAYIFLLGGMAVAYGYFRKREMPKAAAVGFSLLGLLLGQVGMQLYIYVAVFDSMFDFRGLGHGMMKRPEETP